MAVRARRAVRKSGRAAGLPGGFIPPGFCFRVVGYGEAIVVTDANFDQTLAGYPLVLVDFWAEWCAPCRMIAPILEELAREYEGKLVVAKLDVDENPKTAMRYRVMSIPTVILFKNGQPVEVLVGAQPKRNFEAKIQKHLPASA